MFKAKVYSYSNVNGKEKRIEKEFDNEKDYQSFIKESGQDPSESLGFDWSNMFSFNRYLDDFFNRKMDSLYFDDETPSLSHTEENGVVDIAKYETEFQKLNQEKEEKKLQKERLENTLERLKEYKTRFKEEGRDDLIANIDEDVKKVKEELKKL